MISVNLAVRVLDHFSFNITNYIAFCFTIGFCWTLDSIKICITVYFFFCKNVYVVWKIEKLILSV